MRPAAIPRDPVSIGTRPGLLDHRAPRGPPRGVGTSTTPGWYTVAPLAVAAAPGGVPPPPQAARAPPPSPGRQSGSYYWRGGGGHIGLGGDRVDGRGGTAGMIEPGCRHRAVAALRILNVVVPPFDPEDEWFDE